MKSALAAEFGSAEAVVHAAKELRALGYVGLDGFSPYPLRALEDALGLGRSRIGFLALPFAIAGAAGAYVLQWWANAVDYVLFVGGRPANAAPAFVPITFEMGVLATAFSSLVALAIAARLVVLWHPVFELPGFERASIDRFWIAVDAADPAFETDRTRAALTGLGATRIEWLGAVSEAPEAAP